jgi:hypothetical protein
LQVVFITYVNRSGSTFLINQLSRHPQILVMPEGEVLVRKLLYDPLGTPPGDITGILQADRKLKHWNWELPGGLINSTNNTNAGLFFQLLDMYRDTNAPGAKVVVFKAWELVHTIGRLPAELTEKYRIRYYGLLRDIRAVVASQRTTLYRSRPLENNTLGTVIRWKEFLETCRLHQEQIRILEYEKMIRNYREFFNSLMTELGLAWDPSMEENPGKVRGILTADQVALHPHIDEKPDEALIDRWEKILPPEEILLIQDYAGREMNSLGYPVSRVKARKLPILLRKVKYYLGYLLIKACHSKRDSR